MLPHAPFGAGPRICIGAAFAMAEAMIILATIAQRYRLRLKPGFPVEPQGLDYATAAPRFADDLGAADGCESRRLSALAASSDEPVACAPTVEDLLVEGDRQLAQPASLNGSLFGARPENRRVHRVCEAVAHVRGTFAFDVHIEFAYVR